MTVIVSIIYTATKIMKNDEVQKADIPILLFMFCKMLEQDRHTHNLAQFGVYQKVEK